MAPGVVSPRITFTRAAGALRFNETDPGREDFVVAAGSFAKSLQNNISKPVSGLLKLARGAPKARFP